MIPVEVRCLLEMQKRLVWPVHPFNPYANAPEDGLAHAVAALSVPIRLQAKPGHPVRPNEQEIKFRLVTE